jgi:hypothetical protein
VKGIFRRGNYCEIPDLVFRIVRGLGMFKKV